MNCWHLFDRRCERTCEFSPVIPPPPHSVRMESAVTHRTVSVVLDCVWLLLREKQKQKRKTPVYGYVPFFATMIAPSR